MMGQVSSDRSGVLEQLRQNFLYVRDMRRGKKKGLHWVGVQHNSRLVTVVGIDCDGRAEPLSQFTVPLFEARADISVSVG